MINASNNRGDYKDRLQFIIGDVNEGKLGHNLYDIVFAKAALHHVEKLESLNKRDKILVKD